MSVIPPVWKLKALTDEQIDELHAEMAEAMKRPMPMAPLIICGGIQIIPKIAILGYGRAGKDEGSEFLAKHTALRFPGSTSEIACPYVAERLRLSEEEAFRTRHERRDDWYRICNELRENDPLFLVRKVLERGDIVCGLRDAEEVSRLPELGVSLRIWVHRDVPYDKTTRFGPEDCDVVALNTHPTDLTPYFDRLARLVRAMGVECSWRGNGLHAESN